LTTRTAVAAGATLALVLGCGDAPAIRDDGSVVRLKLAFTNVFLLRARDGYLQIDTSYPDTYTEYCERLADLGIPIDQIGFLVLTHHHDDHAGFAAALVRDSGARLVAARSAREPLAAGRSEETMSPANACTGAILGVFALFHGEFAYPPLTLSDRDLLLDTEESEWLRSIGIQGDILLTPGHTHDSISVLLDDGSAFVGDLAMNFMNICRLRRRPIFAEDMEQVYASWERLRAAGATKIYTAHGEPFPADELIPSGSAR